MAIAAPGYPAYRSVLQAVDLEPVGLTLREEDGFVPTAAALRAAHAAAPLSGLLVMSPANPSGTMIDEAGLRSLAEACREMNIRFISDEIYHG